MKKLKQILEKYEPLEESSEQEKNNLVHLARAGFISESRISILSRALRSDISNMTVAEKKVLQETVKELSHHIAHEQKEFFTEAKEKRKTWDAEVPVIIVLRRKAIRVYPDNQKIALYFSQALNRHISIPFGPNVNDIGPQINEDRQINEYMALIGVKNLTKEEDIKGEDQTMSGNARETFRNKLAQLREAENDSWWGRQVKSAKERLSKPATSGLTGRKYNDPHSEPGDDDAALGIDDVGQFVGAGGIGAAARRLAAGAAGIGKALRGKPSASSGNRAREERLSEIGKRRELGRQKRERTREARRQQRTGLGVAGAAGAALLGGKDAGGGFATVLSRVADALNPKGRSGGDRGFGNIQPVIGKSQQIVNAELLTNWELQKRAFSGGGGMPGNYSQPTNNPLNESSIIDALEYIVENNQPLDIQFGENKISINKGMAKKVLTVYESLSKRHKSKYEKMLTEDAESFKEALNFALRQ